MDLQISHWENSAENAGYGHPLNFFFAFPLRLGRRALPFLLACLLFVPLLPVEFASGQTSITPVDLRWHASTFQDASTRRIAADEGATVYLHLEITNVTQG